MALVAALKTLLHLYLGQEDLRVATIVANRNRPGTEGLIGPLANTVDSPHQPRWRPQCSGGDASGSCDNPRSVRHQDLPFEELARDSRARARPEACGDGPSYDFVAECHFAAHNELWTTR